MISVSTSHTKRLHTYESPCRVLNVRQPPAVSRCPPPATLLLLTLLWLCRYTGHSSILLIGCLMMLLNEKKLLQKNMGEMVKMTFGGRYMLFLMVRSLGGPC